MTTHIKSIIGAPQRLLKMNTHSVQFLFDKYEEIGFLYPAKKKLLAPHFKEITQNWEKLYHSKERLLWTLALHDENIKKNFASITAWKQSNQGLIAQHLVSTGNPFLSLKVMLRAQQIAEFDFSPTEVQSSQNWFRPNNRYAYRIFASMFDKLGPQKAALNCFQYLHLPLEVIHPSESSQYRFEVVMNKDPELEAFLNTTYGEVFTQAEELDQEDIQLAQIGVLFKQYNSERYRHIYKIRDLYTNRIVACLIANRAPLGLNFSFLENRAYYILDEQLGLEQQQVVGQLMNHLAKATYQDFPLQAIPIVTNEKTRDILLSQGAIFQREYMQSIWLRSGFRQWYEHIDSFLQRIERRANKIS